jgi:hypothetical protein
MVIESFTPLEIVAAIVALCIFGPPAIGSLYASALLIIDRLLDRTRNKIRDEVSSKTEA